MGLKSVPFVKESSWSLVLFLLNYSIKDPIYY